VEQAVDQAISDLGGRLDIFVANAGIPWVQGSVLTGDLDHYRDVIAKNVDGTFYCARAVGKVWKRQKETGKGLDGTALTNYREGSFIATASISGLIVNIPQSQAVYNASKAAIVQLCKKDPLMVNDGKLIILGKSLAVEWVRFARVNTVSPGYIATDITSFADPAMKNVWKGRTPMGREGTPHELQGIFIYLASDAASYTTGM